MPRTALNPQTVTIAGLTPAYTAANVDGHSIVTNGRQFLHVKNGGGAPITVTVQTPVTVKGRAVAEDTVTVTNAQERMIGPFTVGVHDQASGADRGKVYVDFSAITSVTVAAITVP
jgi:hypothetical protein